MFKKSKASPRTTPAAKKLRVGIVAASYNPELVDALLHATQTTLLRAGIRSLKVVRVPGSYEIAVAVAALARSRKFDVLLALGVVIQGKTSHAEHITLATTINLQCIAVETGVPVIHQILSPKNVRDAKARVRVRGAEAAISAIRMAEIMKNEGWKTKSR